MKKILAGFAAISGLIPGVAIIQSGLGVPPDKGYNLIFDGVVEALGVILLLILWINRGNLRELSVAKVTQAIVRLSIIFVCCLVVYLLLFKFCIVTHDPRGIIYYPLWTTGEVAEMIEAAGGRWAAIETYGRYAVYGEIEKMGPFPIFCTTAFLLILYLGIFTTLTLAFGISAFYEKNS